MTIQLKNKSNYIEKIGTTDWWEWTVFLYSDKENELDDVQSVIYYLGSTFTPPIVKVTDRENSFSLTKKGSAAFDVSAKVEFKSKKDPLILKHKLDLYKEILEKEQIKAKREIIEYARRGVEIASQAESIPLIPLFNATRVELAPELKVAYEQLRYNYYLVELTFSTLLSENQFLQSTELGLTLKDDVRDTARRTRIIRLFPARKDIQFFRDDILGAIGIDASFNIFSLIVDSNVAPYASVAADTVLKSGVVLVPFAFQFRKAVIEVKEGSDQNVLWRYNFQTEIAGVNDFKVVLILKIPEEAKSVQMVASLGVVSYKRNWMLFKEMLPMLSESVTLPVELARRPNSR